MLYDLALVTNGRSNFRVDNKFKRHYRLLIKMTSYPNPIVYAGTTGLAVKGKRGLTRCPTNDLQPKHLNFISVPSPKYTLNHYIAFPKSITHIPHL